MVYVCGYVVCYVVAYVGYIKNTCGKDTKEEPYSLIPTYAEDQMCIRDR